ncbi:MAG: ABC transporter permease [Lachnospiraceae bacterium]|nr:ABC transporter permease [Lachnospiraceae bacterium]
MSVLFLLQLKRAVKAVPRIIAGALIPLFFAGMAVFWAQKQHTEDTGSLLSPVALVNHDSESHLDVILPMITETEAASSFSFQEMNETEAMDALEAGDVCAVLVLPKEMMEGILDSTNIPAKLYLSGGDSFPSLLIGKYAEAGSLTLGSAQAGIYAATDLYAEYGITSHLSDIYYDINTANLKYALSRESTFLTKASTAIGEFSLIEYYGCTLLLCLLLFLGAGMGSFLGTPAPKTFSEQLRRNGMGPLSMELSLFLPLTLFYLMFTFALAALARRFLPGLTFSGSSVLFFVCMALCFSAYTQLIFSFAKNAGQGLLIFTFLGLLMILFAGGFLPYAFLPKLFSVLTPVLPLGACLSGLRSLVGGALSLWDTLLLLLHTVILLGLLIALSLLNRKEVRQ